MKNAMSVVAPSTNNKPGVTQFEVLSKVRTWQPWMRPFTHIGSSIENIRRDMVARRSQEIVTPILNPAPTLQLLRNISHPSYVGIPVIELERRHQTMDEHRKALCAALHEVK